MKLRWTRPALSDLVEAQNYITRENPIAAPQVAQRVWDAALQLLTHPDLGRPGHVTGTREWVVAKTPISSSIATKKTPSKFCVFGTPSRIGKTHLDSNPVGGHER